MRRPLIAALTALLGAPAAGAETVNVYSFRQPELVEPLFDAFTERTGITVNSAFIDKGLVERLVAEGRRTEADLILTVDIARLAEAVAAGVTRPVSSAALDAAIPAALRDPAGHWFGLTTRARVVYAAKDRVKAGEITTYEDLADAKWQGRICTRSGTHDYNLALFAAHMARHGEAATQNWLSGIKANLARRPQGNDRAQVKAIWAGECDISLGNTYYMGLMLSEPEQRAWADAVRIVFPVFEGGGTHVNVSGIAMTRAAPHPEAALKLMEFLVSPEAQAIYAGLNHEYPVLEGAEISAVVAAWGDFAADGTPLGAIAEFRASALRAVETVGFDD